MHLPGGAVRFLDHTADLATRFGPRSEGCRIAAQEGSIREPASLRIGARGSRLSTAQFAEFSSLLSVLFPGARAESVLFGSPGDRDKKTPLPSVADEDFFTRDIDDAVRSGVVDAGLHSAKDLPRRLAPDLTVVVRTPCFAPWECLVTRDGATLRDLLPGARIGTSSARRAGLARLTNSRGGW